MEVCRVGGPGRGFGEGGLVGWLVGWLVDTRKLFDPVDRRNPAFTN